MISNESLSRFIYDVSVDDDTFEVIGKAFAKLENCIELAN